MIASRIRSPGKITLLPNGTTGFWLEAAEIATTKESQNLRSDEFIWTFAGNIGRAQGLDTAVKAASLLGDGFRLVLLGDGPAKEGLRNQAAVTGGSIDFRPQLSPDRARALLGASDALLVSLSADPVFESFVPSKLFDFCATQRPVILAAAGEPARLAGEAVLSVPPDSPEALAGAVRKLRDNPDLGTKLGAEGRLFARRHQREAGVAVMEATITAAAQSRLRPAR
jgi:glycosyltransferase involved in cell wall biosynthesis